MGRKHWEKDNLLVTSNLSFSHGVFKRLILQICKGLFGKGLTALNNKFQDALHSKIKIILFSRDKKTFDKWIPLQVNLGTQWEFCNRDNFGGLSCKTAYFSAFSKVTCE